MFPSVLTIHEELYHPVPLEFSTFRAWVSHNKGVVLSSLDTYEMCYFGGRGGGEKGSQAQSGLELHVLLPPPPQCWNYKHVPPTLDLRSYFYDAQG